MARLSLRATRCPRATLVGALLLTCLPVLGGCAQDGCGLRLSVEPVARAAPEATVVLTAHAAVHGRPAAGLPVWFYSLSSEASGGSLLTPEPVYTDAGGTVRSSLPRFGRIDLSPATAVQVVYDGGKTKQGGYYCHAKAQVPITG